MSLVMIYMPYEIWFRQKVTVLTDPQRRVYHGAPFSSEERWTPWARLYGLPSRDEAEASAKSWRTMNPKIEYEVRKAPEEPA